MLLKQVVGALEEALGEIVQAYGDRQKATNRREPRLPDTAMMLQTTTSIKRTFICINALEEFPTEHRVRSRIPSGP